MPSPCLLWNCSERGALFFENEELQQTKAKPQKPPFCYWSAWYHCNWLCISTPYIAILSTRVIWEDGDKGENSHRVSMSLWRRNHYCVLSSPQQLVLLGINVFPLLLSGILAFFIQHDPMVCSWIEIHMLWISITKAYLRTAWKTCHLRGGCSQDKCFLQPQLPSKLSQRLPYQIYQSLLGNY